MKENGLYLILIREALEKILQYTESGKEAFLESTLIQDAVVRNFERISDAAARLSDDFRDQYPSFRWEELASLKHVLLYPDVNAVWNTVEKEVAAMLRELADVQM